MKKSTIILLCLFFLLFLLLAIGYLLYRHIPLRVLFPQKPAAVVAGAEPEALNSVSDTMGSINIYFDKSALTCYALPNNQANYHINLENRLLKRINAAAQSIDLTTYEINLTRIIEALIAKAASGVQVRIIADAKDPSDPEHMGRYKTMCLLLEKLIRGKDLRPGTNDDCRLLADSPVFAVEDTIERKKYGLPITPADLLPDTIIIGRKPKAGHLLALGEQKKRSGQSDYYYAPQPQMHNKFVIIDDEWVWTGSWNFTVTGLYGTPENQKQNILAGNAEHSVEIHYPPLATIYKTEFEEMWGSSGALPNPARARFHGRKKDNTPHVLTMFGKKIEVYFSPGDNAVKRLTALVQQEAQQRFYFSIFAWSSQALVNELKVKWEGSANDLEGTLTGFDIRGVFDRSYWDTWWSASVDMTGRRATRTSRNNRNIRWNHPAPVFVDQEPQKLHAKTMIIDGDTDSDPTVVMGSTNWSMNGEETNDENLLIIHDRYAANQCLQEFYARYQTAGGKTPKCP